MPESSEIKKLRGRIKYELEKQHPDWPDDRIRQEASIRIRDHIEGQKRTERDRKISQGEGRTAKTRGQKTESTLSAFGILYRKTKDDFTLVYINGEKYRPLRSLKTGMSNPIAELGGLRVVREKATDKEVSE